MQRFRASSFGSALTHIAVASATIRSANIFGVSRDDESDRLLVREALAGAKETFDELPFSIVIKTQFERLEKSIEHVGGAELNVLLSELSNNIMVELSAPWFLMIPADRREQYEQKRPAFGDEVFKIFPDGSADIAASSRCFALEEWTACVFHSMRVLEHGLRWLAKKVGLDADAISHENWKNVIDQIERKIREIEALPKSPKKIERARILSSLAIEFRYFKDAWRNHVSHAHANYDQYEGEAVWIHVRSFMRTAADNDMVL